MSEQPPPTGPDEPTAPAAGPSPWAAPTPGQSPPAGPPPPPGPPPPGQPPGPPPYGPGPYGQPPYGQPPYGQPYGYGYPTQPTRTNSFAIASIVCAFLCTPLGLIFGFIALSQVKQSGENGRGLAIAGIVISVLGIVVALAVVGNNR